MRSGRGVVVVVALVITGCVVVGWLMMRHLRADRVAAIESKQQSLLAEAPPARVELPAPAADDVAIETLGFRVAYPKHELELIARHDHEAIFEVGGVVVNIKCFASDHAAATPAPDWGKAERGVMSLYSWARLEQLADPSVEDPSGLTGAELREIEQVWDARAFQLDALRADGLSRVRDDAIVAWGADGHSLFVHHVDADGSECVFVVSMYGSDATLGLTCDMVLWLTLERFDGAACCDD